MDACPRSFRLLGYCCVALALDALTSGCSGGRGTVLGSAASPALAPIVTIVTPVDESTNVPINISVVSAAFSEPMAPISDSAAFTLTCAAPCTNPTGTASLDVSGSIARFTLSFANLAPLTLYTATLTGARSFATGVALASPYVWRFTTGAGTDTTAP